MPPLERIWDERNRKPVLVVSVLTIAIVAFVDLRTKAYVSLGFLYLFPIILLAAFLPRWAVALIAVGCGVLAEMFSELPKTIVCAAWRLRRWHWPDADSLCRSCSANRRIDAGDAGEAESAGRYQPGRDRHRG